MKESRTQTWLRGAGLAIVAGMLLLWTPSGGRAQAQQSESAAAQKGEGPLRNEPPSMPVEEIIRRFAAREEEFKQARENYTYTQTVRVEASDAMGGYSLGEFRLDSDILFTDDGKRFEKITYAPQPTLQRISISREDMADLANIQPFVLTTEELPQYDLEYAGRQRMDEITTYVFDVKPRRIEKNRRYFEGRIWVDDRDLQIVKTYGKAVPDLHPGKGNENLFPRFATYRQNIEGDFWFPTYTHADDVLHFSGGPVRVRMTVRYANYKLYKVTTRILGAQPVKPDEPKPPEPPRD